MSQPSDPINQIVIKYLPALGASFVGIVSGIILVFDDSKDFGKTDRWWHHAYTGWIPLIGGLSGLALTCYEMMKEIRIVEQRMNTPMPMPVPQIKPKKMMEFSLATLQQGR